MSIKAGEVQFDYADLSAADLSSTDLWATSFLEANLADANLSDVLWSNTRCPDGVIVAMPKYPRRAANT